MKLIALVLFVGVTTAQSNYYTQQPRTLSTNQGQLVTRFPTYSSSTPQQFRPSPLADDDVVSRNVVTATPKPAAKAVPVRRPAPDNQREYQHQAPVYRAQPQQQQQLQRGPPAQRGQYTQQQLLEEEELEEEEKPDRLTELLPQSKFDCGSKKTGYYADDGLGCEVFHYCQDNSKHSWICPEGFQFHQVHLICMPPSADNICAQSADYHFVNDYLYRPINAEEHQNKPNVTLRYADRYYPENYYEDEPHQAQPQRHAVQQAAPVQQRRPAPQPIARPQYVTQQPTARPQHYTTAQPRPQQFTPQQFVRGTNQVFHSPEEVNIPLQHRRPVASPPPRNNNYQERDDDEDEDEEYEYEDPPYRQG